MNLCDEISSRKRLLERIAQSKENVQAKARLATERKRSLPRATTPKEEIERAAAETGHSEHIDWCSDELQRLTTAEERIRSELEAAKAALG